LEPNLNTYNIDINIVENNGKSNGRMINNWFQIPGELPSQKLKNLLFESAVAIKEELEQHEMPMEIANHSNHLQNNNIQIKQEMSNRGHH
jgi:hypothetical protein